MSDLFCEDFNNGILTVTLNRPEIHNAFNDQLIELLCRRFEKINSEDEVRVVVLAGEGKSFCAGADLNWMKKMKQYSHEENVADSKKLAYLFQVINECSKPVVAKVQGAALGGGTGLVAACDYVIASEKALFGFTEVRLGLIPAVISPYVIAKVGESSARAYFLSGNRFDANKAKEIGLVHEVVTSEKLNESVEIQASSYLKASSIAVSEAKKLIENVLAIKNQNECIEYTSNQIASLRASTDGQEGMSALLEKRKPKWI